MMISDRQIRAARALLDMSQAELCERSGLSPTTIKRMEDPKVGPARSSVENLLAVQKVFEDAGIEFLNHGQPGVRLVKAGASE